MRFIDLFAGIGGFRHGLEKTNNCPQSATKRFQQTELEIQFRRKRTLDERKRDDISDTNKQKLSSNRDFDCVWSNEWDKYARQIYKKHYGECDGRDIRTVPSKEIPNHDLLCAGFPCQSFSVAGKRGGFNDTRGTLFFEIARVLRDKRPRYFLLENVKGLLSHQEGKTFQTILGVLTDLGYRCEWQVLNSKHFGVPQNRERVFIIGCLGGESGFQVFPVRQERRVSGSKNERSSSGDKVATALTEDYRKVPLNRGEMYVFHDKRQAKELRVQKEPCVTKHYGTGGGNVPMVIDENIDGNLYMKDIVPTLRSPNTIWNKKLIARNRIRRLTPIECERLQGFPDNWTQGVSDTQRYKALGNAVTVSVVEAIGRRLI